MSGIKNEINLGFKSKCFERIPATSYVETRNTTVSVIERDFDPFVTPSFY